MKQFDSSIVGQPYSRVMFIGIRYTAPMTAVVNVNLQQHVKLLDGTHPGARVVPDDELMIPWSAANG